MKAGIRKEIDWTYLGAVLARETDEEQVEFLKAFVKECLSWGTSYQVDLQLAAVRQKLTKEERKVLGMLGFEDEE